MLAPVRDSLVNNTPLHWQRVGRLPEYVYFDHSVHIVNGIGCSSCHGDMTHMQMTYQPHAFSMAFCVSCHRAPQDYLRPQNKIFDMQWQPPADQAKTRSGAAGAVSHQHLWSADGLLDMSSMKAALG